MSNFAAVSVKPVSLICCFTDLLKVRMKGKQNKFNYSTPTRSKHETSETVGTGWVSLFTRLYQNKQLQQTNAIVNKHYTCCFFFEKKKSNLCL